MTLTGHGIFTSWVTKALKLSLRMKSAWCSADIYEWAILESRDTCHVSHCHAGYTCKLWHVWRVTRPIMPIITWGPETERHYTQLCIKLSFRLCIKHTLSTLLKIEESVQFNTSLISYWTINKCTRWMYSTRWLWW